MAKKVFPISLFKAQCLAILESLGPEGVLITKHGRPIAKVEPVSAKASSKIGLLKGKLKISGDILQTGISWNAEKGDLESKDAE